MAWPGEEKVDLLARRLKIVERIETPVGADVDQEAPGLKSICSRKTNEAGFCPCKHEVLLATGINGSGMYESIAEHLPAAYRDSGPAKNDGAYSGMAAGLCHRTAAFARSNEPAIFPTLMFYAG